MFSPKKEKLIYEMTDVITRWGSPFTMYYVYQTTTMYTLSTLKFYMSAVPQHNSNQIVNK